MCMYTYIDICMLYTYTQVFSHPKPKSIQLHEFFGNAPWKHCKAAWLALRASLRTVPSQVAWDHAVCAYVHTCMHAYIHARTHIHICIHEHAQLHTPTRAHIYIYIYIFEAGSFMYNVISCLVHITKQYYIKCVQLFCHPTMQS